MIKKIRNFKFLIRNYSAGMTYVELIVVMSIFSIMSAVIMFNYGKFQEKVDIKNLASDIALRASQAQKSSAGGILPVSSVPPDWKPAYGVHFDTDVPKSFAYFVDNALPNLGFDGNFNNSTCDGECLEKITITKSYTVSKVESCVSDTSCSDISGPLSITFQRPDTRANFTGSSGALNSNVNYLQITVASPGGTQGIIKVFASGRIEID